MTEFTSTLLRLYCDGSDEHVYHFPLVDVPASDFRCAKCDGTVRIRPIDVPSSVGRPMPKKEPKKKRVRNA